MWLRETVRKWIEGETGKIEGERFGEWVKRVERRKEGEEEGGKEREEKEERGGVQLMEDFVYIHVRTFLCLLLLYCCLLFIFLPTVYLFSYFSKLLKLRFLTHPTLHSLILVNSEARRFLTHYSIHLFF